MIQTCVIPCAAIFDLVLTPPAMTKVCVVIMMNHRRGNAEDVAPPIRYCFLFYPDVERTAYFFVNVLW